MMADKQRHADRRTDLLIALTLIAAALVAGWSLRSAGFFQDDWLLLALSRHLDHPGLPYVSGTLHEFYYRPSWFALWWISERLFGHHATSHYLLSLFLHAGSGVLLSLLVARISRSRLTALISGLVFVLLPPAFGTVMWLANRNELLAVFAGLAALLVLERHHRGLPAALLLGLCLFVSVTAKENGLLFAGLAFLRLAWRQWTQRSVSMAFWPAVVVPALITLAMRSMVIAPVALGVTWDSLKQDAPRGILAWFELLPQAIYGLGKPTMAGAVLASCVAVIALLALIAFIRDRRHGVLLAWGALLVVLPAILQWPITRLVLPNEVAQDMVINLRFYYVSSVGMALLVAAACSSRTALLRWPAIGIAAVIIVMSLPRDRELALQWTQYSDEASRQTMAIANDVVTRRGCPEGHRVILERADWPPYFVQYADAAIKAVAPRGSSWTSCPVFTESVAPYMNVLDGHLCQTGDWPDLPTRHGEPFPLIRPFGNLCLAGFHLPQHDDPLLIRIRL